MPSALSTRLGEALVAITPDNVEPALAELSRLYDPSVVFQDPIQRVEGRDAFMDVNRRLLKRMKKLEWTIVADEGTDTLAFLEWTMRGAPKLGPAVEVSGVTRARARGGLIVDHRDYWDMGEMIASLVPGGDKVLHFLRSPFA